LHKLKRHVAARRARLWWDYPPCCPASNKHIYFTILQIVESAFRTSVLASQPGDLYSTMGTTAEQTLLDAPQALSLEKPLLPAAHPESRQQPPESTDINGMFCREVPVSYTRDGGCW